MMQALLPSARLHLERGDCELAATSAARELRLMGDDRLRAAEVLAVLVDVELARGDLTAANRVATELAQRTGNLDIPALRARALAAQARVHVAAGDLGSAIATLESAADLLDAVEVPWLRVVVLLDLANVRERAGDHLAATADARTAAATLATLDVVLKPSQLALLERLDHAGSPRRTAPTAALCREGKWWVASSGGVTVRLPDARVSACAISCLPPRRLESTWSMRASDTSAVG